VRGSETQFSLEGNGYEICHTPTALQMKIGDTDDDYDNQYMLEVADLLKRRFDADCVLCYAIRVSLPVVGSFW
jgi:hypothetical protein